MLHKLNKDELIEILIRVNDLTGRENKELFEMIKNANNILIERRRRFCLSCEEHKTILENNIDKILTLKRTERLENSAFQVLFLDDSFVYSPQFNHLIVYIGRPYNRFENEFLPYEDKESLFNFLEKLVKDYPVSL